jgi:hypothetical protein
MNIREAIDSLKRKLTVNFVFSNVLIPLGVLSCYLVVSSWLLPPGVNKVFVTKTAKYILPITAALLVAFLVIIGLKRYWRQIPGAGIKDLSLQDVILLLFPLMPVAQYILNNTDILAWWEAVAIFCYFLLLACIPVLVVPLVLQKIGAARALISVGLAFTFLIANMAALSNQFAWHEMGTLKIQLAILGCIWLGAWLIFQFKLRNFLYLLVAVLFVSNTVVQMFGKAGSSSASDMDENRNELVELIGSRKPVRTPDIYLLIYDAYVSNETMLAHGIDNHAQEQFLEDQGFEIYPGTYTVASASASSMSRVLNVSTSYYGDKRRAVSGDGVVQNLLKKYGYQTYGIFPSDYFFRGVVPAYDHSFPVRGSSINLLAEAILVGEFRFDLDFDVVSHDQYVQEKREVFSRAMESPKFMYTHSNLPGHSQNSGACMADEVDAYGERLARANLEMREDIELLAKYDPGAIIIVAGDHGPYLTKNCTSTDGAYAASEISRLDIQDRFGTFLAIRWPTSGYQSYDRITLLQDMFPAIFAYIFEDRALLDSRIEPVIYDNAPISNVKVVDGIIQGGINDGEPLFLEGK